MQLIHFSKKRIEKNTRTLIFMMMKICADHKNLRHLCSLCFAFIFFLSSCNNSKGPDVSKIKVDVKIERFDKDFFSIDTNNLPGGLQKLNAAYPNFTLFFLQQIIGLNLNANNDTTQQILKQIFSSYKPINDSIQKKYPDLNMPRSFSDLLSERR